MLISVTMSGRRYGGYKASDFVISVEYDEHTAVLTMADYPYVSIDFDEHKDFAKELRSAMLGQKAPVDIGVVRNKEKIVCAGETIARLHLKEIQQHFASIDFSGTPWATLAESFKRRWTARELKKKLVSGDAEILIRLSPITVGGKVGGRYI